MSETKRKVPKLRFPGFTEDWEQRKFSELFMLKSGYAFNLDEYSKNGIPIINGESIRDGYICGEKFNYLPNDYIEKYKEFLITAEDIVIGLNRPIINGSLKIARIPKYIDKGMLYQRAGKVSLKINLDLRFVYYLLSKEVLVFTNKEAVGSDQPFIKTTKLNEWSMYLSPYMEENSQIGSLLQHIDDYITLHQRKLENLKLKKKALLQKMFPKNGEQFPELRFPGFTDAWEQRKFSELYEKVTEKNDLSFKLDKVISVASMYYKSDAKVSSEEYLKTYNIFRYGEIAFEGNKSKEYSYGRFVENTIGDGIVSHVFEVFKPIAEYDIKYWKYFINYEPIMGKILSRCTKKTTMMTNLVEADFLKEEILVPKVEEQAKIGEFISKFDNLITLHQRKLEHLQLQKKALLQQMFV